MSKPEQGRPAGSGSHRRPKPTGPKCASRLWLQLLGTLCFGQICVSLAQPVADYSVQLSAGTQESPPALRLAWPSVPDAVNYLLSRKRKEDNSWTNVAMLPADATGYLDSNVQIGSHYEYQLTRTSTRLVSYGYVFAGLRAPLIESRGKTVLAVDSSVAPALALELNRLQQDLVGDGWTVIRHDVPRMSVEAADTDPNHWSQRAKEVVSLRNLIRSDYLADPTQVTTVFLFGHVPVPYSGDIAPDAHEDHRGAWPADVFYGDMFGNWTDESVNNSNAADPRNFNVPGDGKFDPSYLPDNVVLQVGRVDLSNLPLLPLPEVELLRQYLNKDHAFRQRLISVRNRALIADNFGVLPPEVPGVDAWANFAPLVGNTNITSDFWLTVLPRDNYLWAYGSGAGSYTRAEGIADTTHFAVYDLQVVFTMLFGSYFGDWDSPNNFLRAPLTTTTHTLTSVWADRPYWFFHHMGLGETIGYSTGISQNNSGLYQEPKLNGVVVGTVEDPRRSVHVALMGDPTLRMQPVAPPTALTAVRNSIGGVDLSWSASPDLVLGYNVYRAATAQGPYARLNTSPIPETLSTDSATNGQPYYMVRALLLQNGNSGSYTNASQGIFAQAPPPTSGTNLNDWAEGGFYTWRVHDATVPDGTGWNTFQAPPGWSFHATAENPFTLQVGSERPDHTIGPPANFDRDQAYTWPLVMATEPITEFSSKAIRILTSGFQGDLAGGQFRTALSPDGFSINLLFVPNRSPVASPALFNRPWDAPFQVPIAALLDQFTSDPDGDPRALVQLSSSTNGTAITSDSSTLTFVATNNLEETLTYVVQDVRPYRPSDTIRFATNSLTIQPLPRGVQFTAYRAIEVQWASETGKRYQIQSRLEANSQWTNEGDPIAGTGQPMSVFQRADTRTKFYRVITVE